MIAVAACPFCEIVSRRDERPLLWTDDDCVVFEPLGPIVPGHVLCVPIAHQDSAADSLLGSARTFGSATRYAREHYEAFNLITSSGRAATQTVMHLHVHIIPRKHGDGLLLPWSHQDPSQRTDLAPTIDPRDKAILTEVAYRMQAEWPGGDAAIRAVITAAMLARQQADALLNEAMYLHQFGERPPGGENATWADWFRQVETYLRGRMPDAT